MRRALDCRRLSLNFLEMTDASTITSDQRRREMAIEHLLFGTIRFVAKRHPELLSELDASVEHLWDRHGEDRDDAALREIAHRFLESLRHEAT